MVFGLSLTRMIRSAFATASLTFSLATGYSLGNATGRHAEAISEPTPVAVTHTVKRGETLWGILAAQGTPPTYSAMKTAVDSTIALNPQLPDLTRDSYGRDGIRGDHIAAGDSITLPYARSLETLAASKPFTPNNDPVPVVLAGVGAISTLLGTAGLAYHTRKPRTSYQSNQTKTPKQAPPSPLEEAIALYTQKRELPKELAPEYHAVYAASYVHTVDAICAQTTVTKRQLYTALTEQGIEKRQHEQRRNTTARAHYVANLAEEAYNPKTLAPLLGVTEKTIKKYRSQYSLARQWH